MSHPIRVAGVADVKPGAGKVVNANGKAIALFNVDGAIYAIDNTCLHKGGPLGEGTLNGDCVTCPWHGWRFNVKTGASLTNPAAKVSRYEVKVDNGDIHVTL